jgi:uncharacterized membrane protein
MFDGDLIMTLRALLVAPLINAGLLGLAHASAIPSYSCVFTEPFVSVDTFPGGFRFATPDRTDMGAISSFTIKGPATELGGKLPSGKTFSVKIVERVAGDGMSDTTRPYAGTLMGATVTGAVEGACLKFPDGTTPRPVKNIKVNDKLNVRAKPNAKSKIVNRVGPRGMVWAFPEPTAKGWARVATAFYPKGDAGLINIVEGWVNASYLGAPGDR